MIVGCDIDSIVVRCSSNRTGGNWNEVSQEHYPKEGQELSSTSNSLTVYEEIEGAAAVTTTCSVLSDLTFHHHQRQTLLQQEPAISRSPHCLNGVSNTGWAFAW
jgi:hypothetical protein